MQSIDPIGGRMTRKDYVALAAAISEARAKTDDLPGAAYTLSMATVTIANALAADNPRFDRARFYAAAGTSDDHVANSRVQALAS